MPFIEVVPSVRRIGKLSTGIEHHSRGLEILIVTGRDAWAHALTDQWLREHLPVRHAGIYMRRNGDFDPTWKLSETSTAA